MAVGSVGNSVINLTPGALTGVDAGASSSIESDVSDQLKNFQTLKDPAATGPEVAAVQGLLQKQIATLSASSDPKDQATAASMKAAMPAGAATSYKDIQGAVKAFQDGEGLTKPGQPADGVVGQQTFAGLLGVKDDAKFGFGGTGATKTSPDIAATSAAAFDKIAGAKAKLTPTPATGTNVQSSFVAGATPDGKPALTTPASSIPVDVNTASLLNTKLIDVAKLQQGDPTQAAMAHKIIETATTAAASGPAMKPQDFLSLSQALKANPGNVTVGAYYQGEAFKAANPDVANAIASAGGASGSSAASASSAPTDPNAITPKMLTDGLQHLSVQMNQIVNHSMYGVDKLQVQNPNPSKYGSPWLSISEFSQSMGKTAPDSITVATTDRDGRATGTPVTLSADQVAMAGAKDSAAQALAQQLLGH